MGNRPIRTSSNPSLSVREAAIPVRTRTQATTTYRPFVVMPPLLLGIFLRALQMTVIAPSLVSISTSLGSTLAQVGWIMAIYATGSLIAQPIAGRLSDARGRRTVFISALAIFLLGSIACALSTSLVSLVLGRVVQSLGAGALQPAAIAIIGQRVPKERQSGALYLTYGMFALAGALGAVLGGLLIDGGNALGKGVFLSGALHAELVTYPWHLIFWINVPLAVGALVLAVRIPQDDGPVERVGLDAGAIVLLPAAALCVMLAANGSAPGAWIWILGAIAVLVALALWESKTADPFFEPALFANRGPLLLYLIAAITGIPIFSVTMYSAAYYMTQFHASAAQAGVALLALALPLGAGQGLGGWLSKRVDLRSLLVVGVVTVAIGESILAAAHGMFAVLLSFAVVGLGVGLASAPPNALMLRYVSQQRSGAANGLLTMFSSTGAITAPAAVTAFLHFSGVQASQSFRLDFLLSCALAAACAPLALLLPHFNES